MRAKMCVPVYEAYERKFNKPRTRNYFKRLLRKQDRYSARNQIENGLLLYEEKIFEVRDQIDLVLEQLSIPEWGWDRKDSPDDYDYGDYDDGYVPSSGPHFYTYQEMVRSLGCEIVLQQTLGVYEGDLLMLLRKGKQWAFLVVGYASCSGCDSLESAQRDGARALMELRTSIKSRIRWTARTNLLGYLRMKDFETEWYYHEDSERTLEFVEQSKRILRSPDRELVLSLS